MDVFGIYQTVILSEYIVSIYPETVYSLKFDHIQFDEASTSCVSQIDSSFLLNQLWLKSIDLNVFRNVHSIGSRFLEGCRALESLDISPLSSMTSIEFNFVRGCSNITRMETSWNRNFDKVQSVGSCFMQGCSSLPEIDLSSLSNVHTVDAGFLSNCCSLTHLDL
eukprot:PhM_4_TR439/c1_g2_i1/m.20088